MKTTGLTLVEALATGRPFKHKSWVGFVDMNELYCVTIGQSEFYSKYWQVQEEEKPPMRVWRLNSSGWMSTISIGVKKAIEDKEEKWEDCTELLASALAPYLKGKSE